MTRHFWRVTGLIVLLLIGFVALRSFADSASYAADIYHARLSDRDFTNGPTEDYVVFYAAGRLVREGRGEDLYDIDAVVAQEHEVMGRPVGGTGRLAFFNPPFIAGIWAPLSALSIDDALVVWAAIIAGVMIVSALLGPKFLGLEEWSRILASIALLVAEATVTVIMQAQLTAFVLASWILFAGLMKSGRKEAAGLSLALALVKPHYVLLPLAFLIWKHEHRALRGFALAATPLVIVSILIAGLPAIWEYPLFLYESIGWQGINGVTPSGMIGWHGLFARWEVASLAPYVAAITASLALLGVARSSTQDLRAYGVLLVASLLISSHLYSQDMALLIVACWFVFRPWSLALAVFGLTASLNFQTIVLVVLLASWLGDLNDVRFLRMTRASRTRSGSSWSTEPAVTTIPREVEA